MFQKDAALVTRARGGDRDAFAALYERYFDRVYDFLVRVVRDRDEAADVAQDTFIRAMNSLGSLREGANFKAWLFTIARNQALNRLERAGRTSSLSSLQSGDEDAPTLDLPDTESLANPADAAEANEMASIVWEAAAALDARQYSLLDLHVRQGLESAEIAEVLGVTKNNAYVMVNRLKAALEGAVGALVLYRSGRGKCQSLDGIIAAMEARTLSPDLRKAIDKHAAKCVVCQDRRRKEMPLAAFAGLAMVQAPVGVKAHGLEAVMSAWPPPGLVPAANSASPGATNAPSTRGATGAPGPSAPPAAPGLSSQAEHGPGSSTSAGSAVHGPIFPLSLPNAPETEAAPLASNPGQGSAGSEHGGGPSTRFRGVRRKAVVAGAGTTVLLLMLFASFAALNGGDDVSGVISADAPGDTGDPNIRRPSDDSSSSDGPGRTGGAGVLAGEDNTEGPSESTTPGSARGTAQDAGGTPRAGGTATSSSVTSANATATSRASATGRPGLTADTPASPATRARTAGTPAGGFVPGGSTATPTPTSTATRTPTPTATATRTATPSPGAPTSPPATSTQTRTPVTPTSTAIRPTSTPIPPSRTPITPTRTPVTPSPTPVTPTVAPCTPSVAITPGTVTIIGRGGAASFIVSNTSANCPADVAISASPAVSWLSVSPASATLPPSGSLTFTVTAGSSAPQSAVDTRVIVSAGGSSSDVVVQYRQPLVVQPTRTPTPTPTLCPSPNNCN